MQETFPLFEVPALVPRFNIAPTQTVLAIRQVDSAQPRAAFLRWGLVPSWAKDKKIGASLINARADTLATKPSFRAACKRRRCLILADGFYEWQKQAEKKAPKQPYHIRLKDGRPFAFAGLWERWCGEEPALESCTIITTDANDATRPLHDRMPVILDPRHYARWLESADLDPSVFDEVLHPYPSEEIAVVPVSTHVNNARNEGAECLASD